MDGTTRVRALGSTAKDDRVAGLQAQRASIGRHVRPTLIDDADDAQRYTHTLDLQPVRPGPFR